MWCAGCEKMVGRGVRYNAEKINAGKYYTTTLWEFKMKCHMCDGTIIIGTDPKNDDYKIVAGARRKEETWSAKWVFVVVFLLLHSVCTCFAFFCSIGHAKCYTVFGTLG